jgi:hypothetical protein
MKANGVLPALCRSSDSRVNRPDHSRVARLEWHLRLAAGKHSRAEFYRRRGLVAQERAAQIIDLSLEQTFKDVARHWLMLAERVEWLDRQHNGQSDGKNQ